MRYSCRVLVVENLPRESGPDVLFPLFRVHGDISQIRVGNEASTGGRGLVVFKARSSADKAAGALNGHCLLGKYIVVRSFCPKDAPKSEAAQTEKNLAAKLRKRLGF